MSVERIHTAALAAGATVLGDPPHYLLTAEQLAALVADLGKAAPAPAMPPLPPPPPY